jgi:hypothetical protein
MGASMTRCVIKVALLLILIVIARGHGLAVGQLRMATILFDLCDVQDRLAAPLTPYEMRAPILAAFP